MTRWSGVAGEASGDAYQQRIDELAATGKAMHGEADFVAALLAPGMRVLDAGCGTGRVGVELSRRGFDVVGVDCDASMLAVARDATPALTWLERDLSTLEPDDPALGGRFDAVVMAGNVVPLLSDGTEQESVRRLAGCLRAEGVVVAGFGLDVAHLPLDFVPVTLADYDRWCGAVGLQREATYATWERAPFAVDGGYVVSVHRRTAV